jgi:alpha-ketoglutarate-dependent taurine dioxygenase
VPSYLEVVLSYLNQHPRELPDLRCVSVTGEALTKELAERWFAAMPAVRLVNAYGLTETSDDTNHEVMERPPEGDRVPLGRAINNAYIYVVDEDLAPVPLGAPGEIVFSGICVGRGYINDPERTCLAYGPDPLRPGERLYRSGDYGRWRPDGKLEFLGRRDAQVKIRGFRIEIGDIESALLRVPGVRNGAVVVADRADGSQQLAAFYSGPEPLEVGRMQQQLGEWLPEYMVPAAIRWLEDLPLTANGKIDRKRLRPMAAEPDPAEASLELPTTPTERRLASAWASVLSIPQSRIGRRDSFLDLGGTSLSAVRLAVALDREVSLTDVTSHPVLADLAALMDGLADAEAGLVQSPGTGPTASSSLDPVGRVPTLHTSAGGDAPAWAAEHRAALRAMVTEHGSVLVRGLGLAERAEVEAVFRSLAPELTIEREAFEARGVHAEGVYTASRWTASQQMCSHHELSYRYEVPGLIMFACLVGPTAGGETGVADAAVVLEALPAQVTARFEQAGWMLVRSYNDEIGASIGESFGTDDRAAVEAYCRAQAIEFEWQLDGGLRTRQRRNAVVRHPLTGQRCWFNQVAFLNEWTLEPEVREYLLEEYGAEGLPFNTQYGNGDPIGADIVELINETYEANIAREALRAGDLMLIDNIRTAHSRGPFEGEREVLVAMSDPVHLS